MLEPQISLFLHGLALKDELLGLINPKHRAIAYKRHVQSLLNRFSTNIAFEVALSWVDYDILKYTFSDFPSVLRVIHAPFVKGDRPNKVSGQDRFVNLYAEFNVFQRDLLNMIKNLRSFVPVEVPLTIIFHPLPFASLEGNETLLLETLVNNLRKSCHVLKDNNIFIAIENLPFFTGVHSIYNLLFGPKDFFVKLLNFCSCPNVGVTFDFGHANSAARFMWEQGMLSNEALSNFLFQGDFLTAIGHRVFHIHFHYNPAHKISYNLGLNKYIHKLRNYDFHDTIKKYKDAELKKIEKLFINIRSIKRPNTPLTFTLEVLPRSLNPKVSYLEEVRLFENTVLQ